MCNSSSARHTSGIAASSVANGHSTGDASSSLTRRASDHQDAINTPSRRDLAAWLPVRRGSILPLMVARSARTREQLALATSLRDAGRSWSEIASALRDRYGLGARIAMRVTHG